MRNSSKSMEQHGSELNDENQSEEEHKHQTNRFELKVFFRDVHLKVDKKKNKWKFLICKQNNKLKPMNMTQTST